MTNGLRRRLQTEVLGPGARRTGEWLVRAAFGLFAVSTLTAVIIGV